MNLWWRTRTRPPRVFVGVVEISGYFGSLARGLNDLGIAATYVGLEPNPYAYEVPAAEGGIPRLAQWVALRQRRAASKVRRSAWRLPSLATRLALVAWAIARFDVFVFAYGVTMLRGLDLLILRLARKRVICVFCGSDIRPPYMDGTIVRTDLAPTGARLNALTKGRADRARWIERWSDVVISHPLYSQLLTRPFVQFATIGIPYDRKATRPATPPGPGPLRVLHAPSDPIAKGTELVRAAIRTAQSRGAEVDYRELVGVPNSEVAKGLEWADVIVDQAYSDIPWAGFASEAGSQGKPAIVGGYGWNEVRQSLEPDAIAPALLTEPTDMAEPLVELAADRAGCRRLGMQAFDFAQRQQGRAAVERFARVINADIPDAYWATPTAVAYVFGSGVGKDLVADAVRRAVTAGGAKALAVDHHPKLLERLLNLAFEPDA